MPARLVACAGSPASSAPPSFTLPRSAAWKPLIRFSSVVLPAPFGPMTLVMAPGRAVKPTPSTAFNPPKATESPLTSSAAGAAAGGKGAAASGVGARVQRRSSAPTTPVGANRSTSSSPAPNSSSRYSARPDSSSGSSVTSTAPTSGPSVVPAPPTTTTSRNRMDWVKGKELGAMKPPSGACSPPASPASPAETTKASVRTGSSATPTERAATGAALAARIARPSGLRFNHAKAQSAAAQTSTESSAVSPVLKPCPASDGGGMPGSPTEPPVSPAHSTLTLSTMKPKAMVTMARYGPVSRNAGTESSAPMTSASNTANGSAAQKPRPTAVVRMPTA